MASFHRDNLSKSHKHQENTAAKSGTPKSNFSRSMPSSMTTWANSKSAASSAKFSERMERLQTVNSIRKAPVGAQMKLVIDLLLEKRQALTPEEIDNSCHVDVIGNKSVFESLRKNPKVSYDGKRFSYKSKYQLGNKWDLLKLIKTFPEGVAVTDLKDSYTAVMDDLQALKVSGEIWLLSNFDSQEDTAYPNDSKAVIRADDELKQLFREIELPRNMVDIESHLLKNGIKPATNSAKRRAAIVFRPELKIKKKKLQIGKRTKLTNVHLPELFQHLNARRS